MQKTPAGRHVHQDVRLPTLQCHSDVNKNVLSVFKDERCESAMKEYIGLRAKCYSILPLDKSEKRLQKVFFEDLLRISYATTCKTHRSLSDNYQPSVCSKLSSCELHDAYLQGIVSVRKHIYLISDGLHE